MQSYSQEDQSLETTEAVREVRFGDFDGDDIADVAALTTRASLLAYFSNDANGDAAMTTGHSTAPAIRTDGLLQPIIAKKMFLLTSEADGDIDIDCEETGGMTTYLILVMPNGTLVASAAITHAA